MKPGLSELAPPYIEDFLVFLQESFPGYSIESLREVRGGGAKTLTLTLKAHHPVSTFDCEKDDNSAFKLKT